MKNSEYNLNYLNNLEIIEINKSDFIPIEDIESDNFERMIKYPHVKSQQTITTKYLDKEHKKIITKVVLNKKLYGKKSILKRRKWAKFGKASITNEGITSIAEKVFLKLLEDEINTQNEQQQVDKPITKNTAYKVSNIDMSKFKAYDENGGNIKSKGYIPNSIKLKLKDNENIENITIIIKNIPIDETFDNLNKILTNMFQPYGEIKNLKLLKNFKTGNPKDIAFLEYYYSLDSIKLLESNERFIVNNCILSIERSK